MPARDRFDGITIYHIGAHGAGNAGDVVILNALQKMFPGAEWVRRPDHEPFDESALQACNRADLVMVGGGGLFLRDTHANAVSGWRWNCSAEMVKHIEKPLVVFGVGYNRFRNQPDFIPAFSKQISAVVEKSVLFGLREKDGSKLMAPYLAGALEKSVTYQPCPAMFAGMLYPEIERKPDKTVIFAPGWDRKELRFKDEQKVLLQIDNTLKAFEKDGYKVIIACHVGSDNRAASYLQDFPVVNLGMMPTQTILDFYSRASLVIGMRLHSLIIPFSLGVPFLGLASHDKITRFCSDIDHPEWCVDVDDPDFGEKLFLAWEYAIPDDCVAEMERIRQEHWRISEKNLETIVERLPQPA